MTMIPVKEDPEELMFSLEAVLVDEFRVCQFLRKLTQEERQLLIEGKGDDLMGIVEKKEMLLDEISKLDNNRSQLTEKLEAHFSMQGRPATLNELLANIKFPVAERIHRLREGILAIQSEIRDLNLGNHALATLSMERLGALQGFLTKLFTNSNQYQPRNLTPVSETVASWGMDTRV